MLQMNDNTLRNGNYIEISIMRFLPDMELEPLYNNLRQLYEFNEVTPDWEYTKKQILSKIKEGVVGEYVPPFNPKACRRTRIWMNKEQDGPILHIYYMAEIMRCLVEDYKTPLLQYNGDMPIRTAEFEAMMYEMFEAGCRHYNIHMHKDWRGLDTPHYFYETIFDNLFFDYDWEMNCPTGIPIEQEMLESLSIDRHYFIPVRLIEIQNLEESIDWLLDYLQEWWI